MWCVCVCVCVGMVIGRDLNGAIGNFYAAYGEAVGIRWHPM